MLHCSVSELSHLPVREFACKILTQITDAVEICIDYRSQYISEQPHILSFDATVCSVLLSAATQFAVELQIGPCRCGPTPHFIAIRQLPGTQRQSVLQAMYTLTCV